MTRLTPRDRRAILVGAWLVFGALLVGRGAPAWLRLTARWTDLAVLERKALEDARAVIAEAPRMRDSLAARRTRAGADAASVLIASSPAAAVSRLSAIVGGSARDAGLAISSLSLRPDSSANGGLSRPSVRGEARGDISGLMQFLLLIELGPPLMRLSYLVVSQPDPVGTEGTEELHISFAVEVVAAIEAGPARTEGEPDAR